jgi:GMP synthase-like glutamine amidotransferase
MRLPFLGICLGHQLLAAALGGEVEKGVAEVGVMSITLSADGLQSDYFANLPNPLNCLQWHGAEITRLPDHAVVLARSESCAVQAMAVGERALSIQFHVEVTADTVAEWSAVPAYAAALETMLGAGAVTPLQQAVASAIVGFNRDARVFYDNWMRIAGLKQPAAGRGPEVPNQ